MAGLTHLNVPARWLATLWRDAAVSARFLRRNPGFSAVVLVTLALGIGVNTAVFGAFYGIALKPLPFDPAGRLVQIQTRRASSPSEWQRYVSAAIVEDAGLRSTSLQHVAYAMAVTATVGGGSAYEAVDGTLVSGAFFRAYNTPPALGRYLTPADVSPSSPKVAVISHEYWWRAFGGDPAVLGKIVDVAVERPFIVLSQAVPPMPHTVVGVMPAKARFPVTGDVWLPFVEFGPASGHGAPPRHVGNVTALAVLRDGWTLTQAQGELRAVARGLATDHPATDGDLELTVAPFLDMVAGSYRTGLLLLVAAVSSVLLLACVNVSSLLLARNGARRRDVAVRQALGAPRRRILQQLLCESFLLAGLGGAAGMAVAAWSTGAIRALAPTGTPRLDDLGMSGPVMLYAAGISGLVAIVIGVWPAIELSAPQLRSSLQNPSATVGTLASLAVPMRLRRLLVGAQIALAVMLATGAALASQSLGRLLHVDLGFETDRVVTMQVGLSSRTCVPFEACLATFDRIVDGAGRVHGVEAVSIAADRPFGLNRAASIAADGELGTSAAPQVVAQRLVTAGYFDTLGIHRLAGRTFTADDDLSAPRVAVVSQALAARMFGGSALGRRVSLGPSGRSDVVLEIVGEVADVRDVAPASPPEPTLYIPFAQARLMPRVSLLARTSSDDATVLADMRRVIAREDPRAAVTDARRLEQVVAETTANPSFQAVLLGGFSVLGALLAVVGVYGLVSYTVASRMREFGVRMALGGTTRDITTLVLKEGAVSIAGGLAVGGLASIAIGRSLRRYLFEAAPVDGLVVAAVVLALSLAALAAYGGPTRAVSRLNPAHLLRDE